MRDYGTSERDIEKSKAAWLAAQPEQAQPEGLGMAIASDREGYEVMPENADAFAVFLAVSPQWEQPGMSGGRFAVSFTEVAAAIDRMPIRNGKDCFARVQIMLNAARTVLIDRFNEKNKRPNS